MAGEYLHASEDLDDVGRLRALERVYDPGTFPVLSALGITSSWDCLELGAGAGSIARWLARRVGTLTAVDLNIAHIADLAEQPGVTALAADIADFDFGVARYDLIHGRLVLTHIASRDDVVPRLVRALRPNGWLVLEEAGQPNKREPIEAGFPGAIEFEAVWDTFNDYYAPRGSDQRWGRQLITAFASLGLSDLHAHAYGPLFAGGSPEAKLLRISSAGPFAAMVAAGAITQSQFDGFNTMLANPQFYTHITPTYPTIGRKPPSP